MKQTYFKNEKPIRQNQHRRLLIVFILCLGTFGIKAQESLNAAGGSISGANGIVNQSIGQLLNSTVSSTSTTIWQGVQFSVELETLGTNSNQLTFNIRVFPNPSSSELNLQLSKINSGELSYIIYDLLGRPLKSSTISGERTKINIEDLPSAMYQLSIFSNNQNLIKSIKIIKE